MRVHGVAAAGIADLGIGDRHTGAVLAAVEIKRSAADGDIGGLVGVDIGGVRSTSGHAGNRRAIDIGGRGVRNRTDRNRHRRRIAGSRYGKGDCHRGQGAAAQRLDGDRVFIRDGGIGNVGLRRITRQRNGDRAGNRGVRLLAVCQVERRGTGSIGDDGIIEGLHLNRRGVRGEIGISAVDGDAFDVGGGVKAGVRRRRAAGDVDAVARSAG